MSCEGFVTFLFLFEEGIKHGKRERGMKMISSSLTAAFAIAAVCTVLAPVVLLIVLGVKRRISGKPLLLGTAAFFVSQVVIRIPVINALSAQSWFQSFSAQHAILYALLLSLTAGLFEESARLGGAMILKKQRSYKDVISFGLGHGLCEVILLVGLSYVSNALLCIIIGGSAEQALDVLPAETLEAAVAQLTAVNPVNVYWGIFERVSAVIFHIFATMLVFQGVINGKTLRYFLLAITAHMAFNLSGVLLGSYIGVEVSEIVMMALALAGGVYVLKQKKTFALSKEGVGSIESSDV